VTAALREASEELGLRAAEVDIVGAMESYRTITGYVVSPVVGVITPDLPLAPHEEEVADWFEAPLDFLLDPANRQQQSVVFENRARQYYVIEWKGRKIWGATAGMLVNLAHQLKWT
jgi:8-oxo-dGTP pyrophosphatase MutT (NUDIX family)